MKLAGHNGRAGKNGSYNLKHNDRRFDIENSERIDVERAKHNLHLQAESTYGGRGYLEKQDFIIESSRAFLFCK